MHTLCASSTHLVAVLAWTELAAGEKCPARLDDRLEMAGEGDGSALESVLFILQ